MSEEKKQEEGEIVEAEEAQEEPPEMDIPDLPSASSILKDVLESAKEEVEREKARLLQTLRAKDEEERKRKEEEERRKAEEVRRRAEEEKRKREAALREFEEKQRQKALEAQAGQAGKVAQVKVEKKNRWVWVALPAVVLVAMVVVFVSYPRGEPIQFPLDQVAKASQDTMTTNPVPFGAEALKKKGEAMPPERLIASVAPKKYEPPKPVQKQVGGKRKTGEEGSVEPKIEIRKGIFGGDKVIK
jgi:predicted RNase H-like nuclease (RuvC/YqgF family)